MAGTTKDNLPVFLKQLVTWANAVQSQVTGSDAFKNLAKGADVPADSPIWGMLKAQATDPAFVKFLDLCGLTLSAAPTGDATNIQFESFLHNISQSMVQTQQKLDVESARYLTAAASQPHVQPSVFRIPKLSAQMRFALEIQNGKTLNLVFYKQDEKTTSRNEQMIDFDIVTAPAPPGASQAVAQLAPRLNLVLDPFERKRVIDGIRIASPKDGASPALLSPVVQAAADSANLSALVILTAESDDTAPEYLVFLATDDNDHSVGLWKITDPAGSPVLEVILRFARNNSPEENVLKDVIMVLAAKQRIFFAD